jgi:Mn2+/Fe2+ NRAMP family transporter
MAEVSTLTVGGSPTVWTIAYAVAIVVALVRLPYWRLERVLKWLCLILFVYVGAAWVSGPDWDEALRATLIPTFEADRQYILTLVAILGATLSPYFLFFQAAQEVEREIARGRRSSFERRGASETELQRSLVDVLSGSLVSKLITYFVTLTTAATLFTVGTDVDSAKTAATALEPLAGQAATWLFALGIVGTGLLAVPALAASSAYAFAESLRWRASLNAPLARARGFYGILVLAICLGVGLLWTGVPVVRMLFWASVANGLLAPVSILLVLMLTRSGRVMAGQPNPVWLTTLGWCSLALTAVAVLAWFVA